MKNVLITGGAGNIGGSLARRLVSDGNYFVIIVDNLSTGNRDKLPVGNKDRWRFIKADVNVWTDIAPIFLANSFSHVFHYAAVVGVQRTLLNPIKVLDDIEGIKNVLSLSKNTAVQRIFFSSSSEVYGEPFEIPQYEDTTPLNSRLPYAIVKNVGEAYCKSYYQEYGLEYTIFRFFNTYGPLQSNDFVISKFVRNAIVDAKITIYGDGQQSRTFCYIDDNIDTTVMILEHNLAENDVLNVGSDKEITIVELAKKIINLLDSKSKIVHVEPLNEGDMSRRQPNTEKMNSVMGRDLISLEEGILKTAEQIRLNMKLA